MEEPMVGIMKTRDFGDSKWYLVACDCGNQDHMIEMEVEVDEKCEQVIVHTYTTQHVDFWSESISAFKVAEKSPDCLFGFVYWGIGLYNSLRRKLGITWKLWTKGTVKYSADTILRKDAAVNYANTILDAVKSMEKVVDKAGD